MKNRPMELDAGALRWARSPMRDSAIDRQVLREAAEDVARCRPAHGLAENIAVILLPAADYYMTGHGGLDCGLVVILQARAAIGQSLPMETPIRNSCARHEDRKGRNARSTSPHVTSARIVSRAERKSSTIAWCTCRDRADGSPKNTVRGNAQQ